MKTPGLAPWQDAGLLDEAELNARLSSLPGWHIDRSDAIPRLTRTWKTPDFAAAASLAARLAELAEAVRHHPDICFGWGHITVRWCTRDLGGIHENDLRLAHATRQLLEDTLGPSA